MMNQGRYRPLLPMLVCALLLPGVVQGQTSERTAPARKKVKKTAAEKETGVVQLSPDSATIDSILDQAVKNIAARYNLNEAQTAKTNEIMRREVYKFLKTHEDKVWPIIRDLIQAQLGNTPPDDKELMQRIGKAAGEMMGMVEEAILRGNEEWRMYLTPDQKRMHDYDLAEMQRTFQQLEANFEAWAEGKPNPGPLFPPPPPPALSPPRPRQPAEGLPEPEIEIFRPTLFETFVEEFIKKYKLDKAQIESARSILAEYQAKANDFKNSKKAELKKIALDLRTAHEQADRKKLREAEAQRKKLLEPIHRLFGEMNERLMALLTTAQREQFAAADEAGDRRARPASSVTEEKSPSPSSSKRTDDAPAQGTDGNPKSSKESG